MLASVLAYLAVGWFAVLTVTRGRHVVGLILLAVTIAAMARPGVDALDRRVPRGLATAIVFLGGVAALATLLYVQTRDLSRQTERVIEAATTRVDELEAGWLRSFLVDVDVGARLRSLLDDLPTQVLAGTDDTVAAATQGFELLLVVFLAIYALQAGGRLIDAAAAAVPRRHRRRAVDAVRVALRSAGRYLDRTIAAAVLAGSSAGIVAALAGLPGAVVLAVWVGAWSIVPLAGVFVGYAPLIVLAGAAGTGPVVAMLAAGMLWLVADRFVQRWIARDTVRPGPLLATIALMVGIQVGWLVGVVIALFTVAFGVALAEALERARQTADDQTVDDLAVDGERAGQTADDPADDGADAPEPSVGDMSSLATTVPGATSPLVIDRIDRRSAAFTLVTVVAIVAVLDLLRHSGAAPTRVVLGVTLAIALHQLVDALTRRTSLSRRAAAAIVTLTALALVAGFIVLALPSLVRNSVELTGDLPRILDDLARLPVVGGWLESSGTLDRIGTGIDELPDRLAADGTRLEGVVVSAGEALNAAFWILLVTAAALADGPRLVGIATGLVPDRRRVGRLLELVYRAVGRYAAGSATVAAMAGAFVFTGALVVGVPLAALCGVWAAIWNFVPQIGGYVGGAPFIVFAFAEGGTTGLIAVIAYLVYWQLENRVIQPIVISKAVDLSPFVAMSAVLLGAAVAGVVGAVLATPLVGAVKLVVTELRGEADAGVSGCV